MVADPHACRLGKHLNRRLLTRSLGAAGEERHKAEGDLND
jgi:hypothetical protein